MALLLTRLPPVKLPCTALLYNKMDTGQQNVLRGVRSTILMQQRYIRNHASLYIQVVLLCIQPNIWSYLRSFNWGQYIFCMLDVL